MTHDAGDGRPAEPELPTPAALAMSTLATTVVVLVALFGINYVLDSAFQAIGQGPGVPPALGIVPVFALQRIAAVHLRRPPRRARAAFAALGTGLAVVAAVTVGTHLTAPGVASTVVFAAAQLVALPSAAAVYASVLRR